MPKELGEKRGKEKDKTQNTKTNQNILYTQKIVHAICNNQALESAVGRVFSGP